MPSVFVIMDDGKRDLSPSIKFGDPVILFKTSFYPDTAGERQTRVLKHALRILEKFEENEDFLLLVGDLALVAISVAAMIMLGKTKIKMLKYDRRSREYYPIYVNFDVTLGAL